VTAERKDLDDLRWPGSAHEASRFILAQLPGSDPVEGSDSDPARYGRSEEPPELVTPSLVNDDAFRAVDLGDPKILRTSGFCGFLDGTQDVRIVNHALGIPIVFAKTSAAIRSRVNRRLIAWPKTAPVVRKRYYLPFRYVDGMSSGFRKHPDVVDTARSDAIGNFPSRHPAALMEAAVKCIQRDREMIELELADKWCNAESSALYVDGSITGSESAARSKNVVGVIKTHRRLYADGEAFRVLVALTAGQRTSIFNIAPEKRHAVASWYVRVRAAKGRDVLFGLVRVEASLGEDIDSRADEISRWIIAEGSPLALPDGRWDKMAYGIRDTEEFLRAIS
jgi:hypothetical protein